MEKTYKNISSRLEVSFNFDIDLGKMPKNTEDALTYGTIAPFVSHIRLISSDMSIYITGGDAEKLVPFLPNALVDKKLVFKGMKQIIQRENLC
jgi:type III pantothenate kinase